MRITILTRSLRALLALLALPLCACGGGREEDHAKIPPPVVKLTQMVCGPVRCHRYVAVFLDAAEPEDIEEAQAQPFVYSADMIGVLVGTDEPNAAAVGLWMVDTFGTPYAIVRVQR